MKRSDDLTDGLKVDVYWNFHKKRFSVKSRERDSFGLVIAHCDQIYLRSAEFIVSQSGRKRVVRQRRKNVHAFIRGIWSTSPTRGEAEVRYDPYRHEQFMANSRPIHYSDEVMGYVNEEHPIVLASTP